MHYVASVRRDESAELLLDTCDILEGYRLEYLSRVESIILDRGAAADDDLVADVRDYLYSQLRYCAAAQGVTLVDATPPRALIELARAIGEIVDHEDVEQTYAVCQGMGPNSEKIAQLIQRSCSLPLLTILGYIHSVDYAVIDRIVAAIKPSLSVPADIPLDKVSTHKKYMLFCQWLEWVGEAIPYAHAYSYSLEAVGLPLGFYTAQYARTHLLPDIWSEDAVQQIAKDIVSCALISDCTIYSEGCRSMIAALIHDPTVGIRITKVCADICSRIVMLSQTHRETLLSANGVK